MINQIKYTSNYKKILSVEIMHDYFEDGLCPSFEINPSSNTRNILKDYGIEGRVIATFVVNKKGKASDVQILRGLDKKIDDEVVRVIKSLPVFTPGKQRNKPASVRYTVPINVQLQ